MNKISNLFVKHWRNIHFGSVLCLLVIIFAAQSFVAEYINRPVFLVFYSPFANLKQAYVDFKDISDENNRLSQALIEIRLAVSISEEAAMENARLRSVLGFEPPPSYTLLPAEIITIVSDYLPTSVVINRGLNDSLEVDQPVINQAGLIGRISELSTDVSVVQLLTDPSSRVAARSATSREMGIIKYSAAKGMILDNFPIQGTINVGDKIVSSGLGGVYPAGLTIGIVSEVSKTELGPFYNISVSPAADFYSIEELFILKVY